MTDKTIVPGGWEVWETERGVRHVVPVNDFREHDYDCWCHPLDDDGLIVHNSMDQREFYERGDRKLS